MIRFQFRETLALSVLALAGLTLLLIYSAPARRPIGTTAEEPAFDAIPSQALVVYCAAGLHPPVSEILAAYEATSGTSFQTQFEGSGTLLSRIRLAGGDLFIAADKQYLLTARQMNLVGEIFPIAYQTPVIVVPKGNPKNIRSLNDLLESGVRLSLADPKLAAIGKVVQGLLQKDSPGRSLWDRLWQKSVIQRETVNQVANDVKLGAADAGLIWDATAVQYPALEIVRVAAFQGSKNEIAVGLLRSSKSPDAALRFAHYLTAPNKGLSVFRTYGYTVTGTAAAESSSEPHE